MLTNFNYIRNNTIYIFIKSFRIFIILWIARYAFMCVSYGFMFFWLNACWIVNSWIFIVTPIAFIMFHILRKEKYSAIVLSIFIWQCILILFSAILNINFVSSLIFQDYFNSYSFGIIIILYFLSYLVNPTFQYEDSSGTLISEKIYSLKIRLLNSIYHIFRTLMFVLLIILLYIFYWCTFWDCSFAWLLMLPLSIGVIISFILFKISFFYYKFLLKKLSLDDALIQE